MVEANPSACFGSQLGTEALLAHRLAGTFTVSVGGWLIATAPLRLRGDVAASIRLTALTGGGHPPPEGRMLPDTAVSGPDCPAADRPLGNSVGAIGWPLGALPRLRGSARLVGLRHSRRPNSRNKAPPPRGLPAATPSEARRGSG
jgi:hypothetical protein